MGISEKGQQELLRELPSINKLLEQPEIQNWLESKRILPEMVTQLAQQVVSAVREGILQGEIVQVSLAEIVARLKEQISQVVEPRLKKVINATGVILHTNLGRAVLAEEAARQIGEVARSYSNLEYRLEEGVRGSRHEHVEELVTLLTRAEAAMVVNNNAAAVYLILREMARQKEVVVSRGQLVEIGGSFRISEIMRESEAVLVEVGTTNKTHLYDYERAINERTAMLMKVHTSNFRTVGFTETVSLEELVELGKRHEIPVYEDLGSGVIYDLAAHGVGDEPLIRASIQYGADLVSFSGDKLLGGPQAGIIAGKKKWIQRLKKNQLARVLRVDKFTLAGLDATLRLYLHPEQAAEKIPAIRDILASPANLREKATHFVSLVEGKIDGSVRIEEDNTEVGGGTLPGINIPTCIVSVIPDGIPVHQVERNLRLGSPSIVGRVQKEKLILDFRTIREAEIVEVAMALIRALS